ncbi:hypothetical protein [Acinetobacter sp. WCHAc060025]|uniref:hypothetical protein n=1 Tax=Acinetobacter sp. WCHAc060025 TaxID=2518625 RepID=UPI001023CFEE|nr:hypothetical protein [Acinetobacter sp. WCHAc060025]RZG74750.1 hypothetical protein EXE09_12215 [Acinetobacter sp. WCHAc060025]
MTTTTNNLIEQVGGIEKAKAIVEGATFGTHYRVDTGRVICCHNENHFYFADQVRLGVEFVRINDLRTAIEHHYYGRSEAEELAAYAELSHEKIEGGAMLVGDFSEARKIIDKQLESDHVTDIRNHISPNTKVINHG